MSTDFEEKRFSGFWPLVTVSLALVIILIWQFTLIRSQGQSLAQQLEARKTLVDQSRATQTTLEKMVNDLLELAKKDEQAKAIVTKYNIRKNEPVGAAEDKK
jgi:uncharacterized protein YpmS